MASKKSLEKQYNILLPHLEAVANYIKSLLKFLHSSDFILETNTKPLQSIIRKIEDRREKNILKLSDLVRGRLFYSPNYTEKDVMRLLKKIAGDKIKKIDPKKTKDLGLKYKGITHVDFQVGPFTFELQIIPMEFKPFKKLLHRIYEKLRDENNLTKPQKEKLKNLHNKLYDELARKALKNRQINLISATRSRRIISHYDGSVYMSLNATSEIYDLICSGTEEIPVRRNCIQLRKAQLSGGFTKVAFDTRRIDQETEFNPRRGLQSYNRSEAFLSEAMSQKVENFSKLRNVLVGLKEVYGREPEWQDSNARVLLSTLDNGLRTSTHDGDFTSCQPGVGSFDYIEELMHMRYRLGFDDLVRMGEADLRKVILSKDEELIHKGINKSLEITKSDVAKHGYDTLLEKLFDGCRASADRTDVERTVTITIRDRLPTKQG